MRYLDAVSQQNRIASASFFPSFLVPLCAWVALLLGSSLSTVFWIAWLGYKDVPFWDPYVRLLGIAGILALTWLWPRLHALRGFLWAVLAFQVGNMVWIALTAFPPVSVWLLSLPSYQYVFVIALWLALFPALLMALTLMGSGLNRQELFLTKGNMRGGGRILMPFLPTISWMWLAPLLVAVLLGPGVLLLISQVRPDLQLAQRVFGALPVILAFGIINSFQEEFRFRVVFLARLTPVLGARQTLLMSSLLFGLAHWVGNNHPNGLLGALITGLAGWISGASILETRGVAWAWIIHALSDTIVIITLVMTTVH